MEERPVTCLRAAEELARNRDAWILTLAERAPPRDGGTIHEQRQFLRGFLKLIEACARGDSEPREEYLATITPGLKASGLALGYVVKRLCRVLQHLMTLVAPEHHAWYLDFGGDYAERLVAAWERA